ncbi:AraC family transcriptional regulator [Mucilaginibacter sp. KACC 22063]|uniref:AraC family transcriptional regulator n=1 Tax=Mucilaginibacter sp. KACC 22063 TaxID=3025666 RepID=UPI002365D825|nr:AraC family transcriptional regulator [Mucilaginibacter sp. KACC 22063]WDF53325.1 AraC family transcriptional regulator [Mucilaginibacter sp. KACC 22063]
MKVLQFTIPVAYDKSVIFEQIHLPHFYPYLHRHEENQVTWIQQGEGTLVIGNNMHDFAPGDVFFLGPNLPHLFKSNPEYFDADSSKRVKAITVFFNLNGPLNALLEIPEMKQIKGFFQQQQQGFKLPDVAFNEISRIMLSFRDSSGPDQLIQFFQLVKTLYSHGSKAEPLSSFGTSQRISENEGIRISNIYNYIMQYYHESITLEDVANAAHMTPHAFCRYFKKHTGHTFISFLNEVRINEACKKLTDYSFESISSVAYNCGFNSITNFNRVFRIVIGSSPRAYIDNYSKNFNNPIKVAG